MDYLNQVNTLFPVRRTQAQKEAFRSYVLEEAKAVGIQAQVEVLQDKHRNIVIGDPQRAQVIVTAHYDTPATSLLPNLMMPRNPSLGYLYAFGYPVLLALLSLLAAGGITRLFSWSYDAWILIYLVLYFGAYYLSTRAFDNPHNSNDNTSGVAAVLTLMQKVMSGKIAFVLFDNEEKGLLGSKAFAKAHKELTEAQLVINLDCIGVGNHVLLITKDKAMQHPAYKALTSSIQDEKGYIVRFFPTKGSMSNSDYKSFPCGVGVMACKKARLVGYYTPHIHTPRDTEASAENIAFITDGLAAFVEKAGM